MKQKWTLNSRLFIVTFLISIPIILVLIWFNNKDVLSLRERRLEENQSEISAEVSQLDTLLELLDISMINLTVNNSDFRVVAQATERNLDFWRANQRSIKKIKHLNDASTFEYTIFVYYPKVGIFVNNMENTDIATYISEVLDKGHHLPLANQWNTIVSNNIGYALRIIEYDDFYVGAWIAYDDLLNKLGVSETETTKYAFLDSQGLMLNEESQPIVDANNTILVDELNQSWYMTYGDSRKGDFKLVKMVNEVQLRSELPTITDSIVLVASVLIVALTFYILGMFFWVILPMNHMKKSMAIIEAGDMKYRIPNNKYASVEVDGAITQFNRMMDQLEGLKIVVYEGRLERQEIELQYLSQQIQPHFILNTLNTLYNYCERDQKATKDIILLLSKFYRYVVNINSKYVHIGQELEHINNYLKLQTVRFPDSFDYEVNCPSSLEIVPIPPFIIESFVVNAMKYGLVYNRKGLISIDVSNIDEFTIELKISDNGEGFSEDVLDSVKEYIEEGIISEELGIGLRNSIERLKLIYKEKCEISFYNHEPTGAVVAIKLRLQDTLKNI